MSSEIYDPKDYGAVGDGSTDDTQAVLDTIDALPASGGVIAFPSGNFMLDDLDDTSGKSYTVRGAGSGRTGIGTISLAGVTSLTALNSSISYIWRINNSASHYGQRILFQNVGLNGYSTTDGIRCLENPPSIFFEDVSFRELASGVKGEMLVRALHTTWDDCVIGVNIETQESFESSFVGCRFNKNTTAHIKMSGAYNLLATGCYFYGDSNSSRGIDCDSTPGRIQLVGNFFDGVKYQHVRVLGGFFVVVSDNILENGGLDSAGAPSIFIGPGGGK